MTDVDSSTVQNTCNKQVAVTMLRAAFTAHESHSVRRAAIDQHIDCPIEVRFLSHQVIEGSTILVILRRVFGPASQRVTHEHIAQSGLGKRLFKVGSVELRCHPREWGRPHIDHCIDAKRQEQTQEPIQCVGGMPNSKHGRPTCLCHHAITSSRGAHDGNSAAAYFAQFAQGSAVEGVTYGITSLALQDLHGFQRQPDLHPVLRPAQVAAQQFLRLSDPVAQRVAVDRQALGPRLPASARLYERTDRHH